MGEREDELRKEAVEQKYRGEQGIVLDPKVRVDPEVMLALLDDLHQAQTRLAREQKTQRDTAALLARAERAERERDEALAACGYRDASDEVISAHMDAHGDKALEWMDRDAAVSHYVCAMANWGSAQSALEEYCAEQERLHRMLDALGAPRSTEDRNLPLPSQRLEHFAGAEQVASLRDELLLARSQDFVHPLIVIAWLQDRRAQWHPGAGIQAAIDELIQGLRKREHLVAFAHGELDDLLDDGTKDLLRSRES
jgi:hypothetical protein